MRFKLVIILLALNFPLIAIRAQKVKAGQECFPKKNEEKLVYDEAALLSRFEVNQLDQKLIEFEKATSNQIAVIIVPDLCGMEKAQFAIELGEMWGIGQKKEDNGVVMLIKPKTASEKGKVFIAVGRGLEGAIPDARAFLIVDNEVLPRFREGKMFEGIDVATNILMELAKGEYSFEQYENEKEEGAKGGGWIFLIILLAIGVILAARVKQARNYAHLNNVSFWTAWALLNAAQRRHRGYWDNFNRGGGGFTGGGGGGGGGFGGFGGGSFGGGGAGGEW